MLEEYLSCVESCVEKSHVYLQKQFEKSLTLSINSNLFLELIYVGVSMV